MLFVEIKKKEIFMIFKRDKYGSGIKVYRDIYEHIESKATISIEFDDVIKAQIKSRIMYMRRTWYAAYKNNTRRLCF